MTVHEISRTEARRVAVRAQLLDSPRPTDVLDVVRHLTLLQIDPAGCGASPARVDPSARPSRVDGDAGEPASPNGHLPGGGVAYDI